ncbi:MAG: metallophosphoesterase family protein [Planctomycetota bacterium]
MRYAILGDLHSNPTALEAVLAALEDAAVDAILQVGDVVGYGAAPRETIELVRAAGMQVVMGNHDGACTGHVDATTFNDAARLAIRHNVAQLEREDLRWLAALPLVHTTEHCALAHATLARPERFDYIQRPDEADTSFEALDRPVCFLGHTHRPVTLMRLREAPLRTSYTFQEELELGEFDAALVNVGSVGQPRDDDPRAAYALFDSGTARVTLHRVEYDVERESDRILRAGLPKILADRLFLGI